MSTTLTPAFDPVHFGETVLRLRSQRHALLGSNLVNADTPGFKARDMAFATVLSQQLADAAQQASGGALKRTHAAHLAGAGPDAQAGAMYRVPVQPAVDGNTVDPDLERGHFVKNAFMTEGALSFLGSTFRSRLSAITGQSS